MLSLSAAIAVYDGVTATPLHRPTAPPPPVSRPHLCISPGGDLQLIAIQRAPSLYIHLIDGVNGKDYQITD